MQLDAGTGKPQYQGTVEGGENGFSSLLVAGSDPSIFYGLLTECSDSASSYSTSNVFAVGIRANDPHNSRWVEGCVHFPFDSYIHPFPLASVATGPISSHLVVGVLGNGGIAMFGGLMLG